MAVAYRRQEPGAPADLITRLEHRVGHPLPDSYRDYLLQCDGGRLAANHEAVKTVFGIGDVSDWANMWKILDVFQDRVPSWLLPVAADEYGNLFAVSLRDSDRGAVWFWNHEEEADEGEPPSEHNIELKAPDWPSFLESLRPL